MGQFISSSLEALIILCFQFELDNIHYFIISRMDFINRMLLNVLFVSFIWIQTTKGLKCCNADMKSGLWGCAEEITCPAGLTEMQNCMTLIHHWDGDSAVVPTGCGPSQLCDTQNSSVRNVLETVTSLPADLKPEELPSYLYDLRYTFVDPHVYIECCNDKDLCNGVKATKVTFVVIFLGLIAFVFAM